MGLSSIGHRQLRGAGTAQIVAQAAAGPMRSESNTKNIDNYDF
ncbi:hypothetical protein [Streptomyces flaveolus]